ncbi:septal ring lytic transglycosylase RlpA family protein [Granulicella cerasi]|uniref:Probable endolytic peptidoglycan transglycosylase RlpA n=1 Tax=Granulicella cerasi TaxID=741063 RepID=A0ABW1ZCG1_9BACT|nr:SPOR domain-containing protein [Granulicella cerasi]
MSFRLHLRVALLALLCVGLAGCHHHAKYASNQAPDRPDWSSGYPPKHRKPAPSSGDRASATPRPTAPRPSAPAPDTSNLTLTGKPIMTETGMASWYGPSFHNRKAADGSTYDQNGLTAAHRTLPLGSLARVTNLATNESVIVRITDRGPFVRGRLMDLSEGAAKRIDLYRMGVAKVKVEAYSPSSATVEKPGLWAVQAGAFSTQRDANDLRDALAKRYATARIQEFQGPTGYWVRIDPPGRVKEQAQAIREWIGKPDDQADAFLVRLD